MFINKNLKFKRVKSLSFYDKLNETKKKGIVLFNYMICGNGVCVNNICNDMFLKEMENEKCNIIQYEI